MKTTLDQLNEIAASHTFFCDEALGAYQDMVILAADFSEGSQEIFDQANERFRMAVRRATMEFEKFPWRTN